MLLLRWLTFGLAFALAAGIASAQPSTAASVGIFDAYGDVGSPAITGSTSYDDETQSYEMTAGGTNMWADRDEFQFAWKQMTGDFILQARVEFIGEGVDPHRKSGIVVRPGRDADAPYIDGVIHGDGLTSMQYRRTKGGQTEQILQAISGADVLQLERRGRTYIFSAAKYGEPFSSVETADIKLGDDVLVGLALCSHNPAVTERAVFRDVRLTVPVSPDFVPYRDYIGSVLEILDLETGHRREIARSEQPFEAPNWTTDGNALIYNASGRDEGWGGLYRFDLATRRATLIDTGAQNRNNNDHVLSFDGRFLAISDQGDASGGASTIYTVPVEGGTPKRLTTDSPSYAHGWPPVKTMYLPSGDQP